MEQKTSNKKFIVLIVIILLAVVAFVISQFSFDITPTGNADLKKIEGLNPTEAAGKITISEFALGGEVVETANNGFTMKTGWTEKTSKGDVFAVHNKQVAFNTETEFIKNDGTPLDSGYVWKVGDNVNVYGTENPYNENVFTATRVELIEG